MSTTNKLTILFLASSPTDNGHLQLDREFKMIDDTLRSSKYRDSFDLRSVWAVSDNDLQKQLLRYQPHIVHFAGHGDELGQLLLTDETGAAKPVSAEALAKMFEILKDNIRCVVLNACYAEYQAKGIAQSIDFVVGMSGAFLDEAAAKFAVGFYEGIGWGRTVRVAFDLGCNRIDLNGIQAKDQPKLVASLHDPTKVTLLIDTSTKISSVSIGTHSTVQAPHPSRLTEMKRQRLEISISDFERQWLAVDRELRANTDVVTRDRLQQRLTQLEEDIATTETELEALK